MEHERPERADLGLSPLVGDATLLDPLGMELVRAGGADRIRFLNGVVTANVAAVPVGGGTRALLLTPKAHIVSDMRVFVAETEVWLLVAAGQGEATAAALSRYAIMDDFTAIPTHDLDLVGVLGPKAAGALEGVGISTAGLEGAPLGSHARIGGWWVARVKQLGTEGYWVAGPKAEVDELRSALSRHGIVPLSAAAAEAARVAAREPAWGREITDEHFPMEIGLGDAIDYGKGCFLGQEPIVRIRDRGHLNWRLALLELPAGAEVAAGDRLESAIKPKAGKITSVARRPDGRVVALGVVHASVPAGAEVRVAGASPATAVVR